ncbi:MAG TPA: RNA polymerase sporulation sigma factor SigH [Candidatus Saccharimonadales bacterium]|nr:RNA polymerase sporulation sigma factor SigH [Candidatus Saccharimonadales bacterium]
MAILEAEPVPLLPLEADDGASVRHLRLVESQETPEDVPEPSEQLALEGVAKSIHEARARRAFLDRKLVMEAQAGGTQAMDTLLNRYAGFVKLKASNYFLAGGDYNDLIQEGMIGLYKAVRDFNPDMGTTFGYFAELCVTRQLITAITTATRGKHAPLNKYLSFQGPSPGNEESELFLGDIIPAPEAQQPPEVVISNDEVQSLVFSLGKGLSKLEAGALRLHLGGRSYAEMMEELGITYKAVDNAIQRVKRKITAHQKSRQVLL